MPTNLNSIMYLSKVQYKTPWGETILLTCFYKYEQATDIQKFGKQWNGCPICNGAGPKRYGWIIPDNIIGCSITEAANIHDWGYEFGTSIEEKQLIDRTFGDNMDRIFKSLYKYETMQAQKAWYVFRRIKMIVAENRMVQRDEIGRDLYQRFVERFGNSSFWDKGPRNFVLDQVGQTV